MKINKREYQQLKYPFHELKSGESIFDIGDLAPLRELFEKQTEEERIFGLQPDFILKYLILMYAPGSPAIEKFQSLGKRKTWVLSQLGIEPNEKNQYPDHIDYLTLYKVPSVVRKTSAFITLQTPTDWKIRLHAEEQLDILLTMTERERKGEAKKDVDLGDELDRRKLIEETRKQIVSATKRMMENEPTLLQEQDIEKFAAQTYLGIRLEEQLKFLPKMPMPKDQKANTFFPQVGN